MSKTTSLTIPAVGLLVFILVAGCMAQPATSTSVDGTTPATASLPQATPTLTVLPSATLPAELSTPLAEGRAVIRPQNAGSLVKLGQWGAGPILGFRLVGEGKAVAVVTGSGIHIYDAKTLELLGQAEVPIPDQYATAWAISPDGKYFALFNAYNEELSLWDLANGQRVTRLTLNRDVAGCVRGDGSLVFSPDGGALALNGYCNGYFRSSRLSLLRVPKLNTVLHLEGDDATGEGIFSPNGMYFVTYTYSRASRNDALNIWNATTGASIKSIGRSKYVTCPKTYRELGRNPWPPATPWGAETLCVSFSPDGQTLAIGLDDSTYTFDMASWAEAERYPPGRPWFSDDGRLLFVDSGQALAVYEAATHQQLIIPPNLSNPIMASTGVYITGVVYGTGGQSSSIVLRDLAAKKEIARFHGYWLSFFSRDGQSLIVYSPPWHPERGPMLLVRSADGEILQTLENETLPIMLENGTGFLTTSGDQILLRSLPDGDLIRSFYGSWPQVLPGGDTLIAAAGDEFSLWRISDGQRLATQTIPVAPEGLQLLGDNLLVEKNLTGWRLLEFPYLTRREARAAGTTFSPDGSLYAVSREALVDLWHTADGQLLHSLAAGPHNQIVFSPDGSLLAVAKTDHSVGVWDTNRGEAIRDLPYTTSDAIVQMAIDPARRIVFVVTRKVFGTECSLQSWGLDSGNPLTRREAECYAPIRFSPDGTLIAYASEFKDDTYQIVVAQPDGLQALHVIQTHDIWDIQDMSISPDNALLAIAGRIGGMQVWSLVDGSLLYHLIDDERNATLTYRGEGWEYGSKGQMGVSVGFSSDGTLLLRTAGGVATLWGVGVP